jgi:hypothetical protein
LERVLEPEQIAEIDNTPEVEPLELSDELDEVPEVEEEPLAPIAPLDLNDDVPAPAPAAVQTASQFQFGSAVFPTMFVAPPVAPLPKPVAPPAVAPATVAAAAFAPAAAAESPRRASAMPWSTKPVAPTDVARVAQIRFADDEPAPMLPDPEIAPDDDADDQPPVAISALQNTPWSDAGNDEPEEQRALVVDDLLPEDQLADAPHETEPAITPPPVAPVRALLEEDTIARAYLMGTSGQPMSTEPRRLSVVIIVIVSSIIAAGVGVGTFFALRSVAAAQHSTR